MFLINIYLSNKHAKNNFVINLSLKDQYYVFLRHLFQFYTVTMPSSVVIKMLFIYINQK